MLTRKRTAVTPEKIQKSLERDLKDPVYVAKIEARIKQAKRQIDSAKEAQSS